MGSFLFFAFSWWSIALRIVAIVHFIRRRPDWFWIWVILFHWVGALVYILVEVIPDAGLLRGTFQIFPRRRRIHELERIILDNPWQATTKSWDCSTWMTEIFRRLATHT